MGKLPPDKCDFKFHFSEHEGEQDRSEIFSFLEGMKRAQKKTCYVLGVPRVRSRVIMHHAIEAQTCNQDKIIRTPKPMVIVTAWTQK